MAYTTIDKPTDYFNTKLYTGNAVDGSGTTQSVTGLDFSPNLVWIKSRSATKSHYLFDVVRGVNKELNSNNQNDENTNSQGLQSFNSDGFTLGHEPEMNENGTTYCSWNWLAGGTASSNTEGNVTTSVSANTTAGFSVVTYSGNGGALTIGHGLNAKPSVVIVKNRTDNSSDWIIGHKDLSSGGGGFDDNKFLKFDTSTVFTNSLVFGTEPTTTTIALTTGNAGNLSGSGKDYVAYCFAEKKGYSRFGRFTGGGSSFPFIYTGFKPAYVMIKKATGAANSWCIGDNKRSSFNIVFNYLLADRSDVDESGSGQERDFLSNGFKIRNSNNMLNTSGETYIYMAFAEAPFVSSSGIPTTAR